MVTLELPLYRRSANGEHLYRLDAPGVWVELQRVGSRWLEHRVATGAYPERVRWEILAHCQEGNTSLEAAEFERVLARMTGGDEAVGAT